MIFFLATTDLSLVQVGLALSLSALLSLPAAILVGQQVDRLGSKTVLQAGNALQAVSFLLYPFVDQVWSVALVVSASVIGRTAFWGSYSPMVTLISPPGEREKWFGFLGALRNAGFAIGGVVAGVALTVDATALYYAVALLNAASYVLSLVLLAGVRVDERAEDLRHADPKEVVGGWGTVLSDRGYRWFVASNFCYAMTSSALNVAIPVYVVEMLGLPGWVVRVGLRHQHPDDRRRPGAGRPADDRGHPRPDRRRGRGADGRVVPDAAGRGAPRGGRGDRGDPGRRGRLHLRRDGWRAGVGDLGRGVAAAGAAGPLCRDLAAVVERRLRRRPAALCLAAGARQRARHAGPHGHRARWARWSRCRCDDGSRTPTDESPTGPTPSRPEPRTPGQEASSSLLSISARSAWASAS